MEGTATRKYSPRRSRDERREQLLDAALRLVDSGGFDAFSIEAVAREAGLTKSVVYASFENREELLRALVDREIDRAMSDIATAIPRPPYDDPDVLLRESLERLLRAVRARPSTWRLFVLPADGMPIAARENVTRHRERLHDQIEPLISWGLARLDAPHLDAEVMTRVLLASFEQAARMTLTAPEDFTPERLVKFAEDFVAMRRGRKVFEPVAHDLGGGIDVSKVADAVETLDGPSAD